MSYKHTLNQFKMHRKFESWTFLCLIHQRLQKLLCLESWECFSQNMGFLKGLLFCKTPGILSLQYFSSVLIDSFCLKGFFSHQSLPGCSVLSPAKVERILYGWQYDDSKRSRVGKKTQNSVSGEKKLFEVISEYGHIQWFFILLQTEREPFKWNYVTFLKVRRRWRFRPRKRRRNRSSRRRSCYGKV